MADENVTPFCPRAVDPAEAEILRLAELDCSDLGNARRLAVLHGGVLAFVRDRWLGFDGVRWNATNGLPLAQACAQSIADHLFREAAAKDTEAKKLIDEGRSDAAKQVQRKANDLRDWAVESGNAHKTQAMLRQAQILLARDAASFDTHLEAFNCLNGTLWIERSTDGRVAIELRKHDPADLITRVAAATYDPRAHAGRWAAHLERVLPTVEVRSFFQACAGYWLTGHHREQKFFLLLGRGGDGKSTTMNVLRRVWGDYAASADAKLFLEGRLRDANEASPAMARLAGDVRLVSLPEPSKGATFAEDVLKKFTGGGELSARNLRSDPFEFVARGKGVMEANVRPRVKSGDDGLFRRLVIVPFPTQLDRTEMMRGFEEELFAEASGVLNWALEGKRCWLASGGLDEIEPQEVTDMREDYRRAGDSFTEWFLDNMVLDAKAAPVEQLRLHQHYNKWCEENGIDNPISAKSFGVNLSDRQVITAGRVPGGGRKLVKGGRLKDWADRKIEERDRADRASKHNTHHATIVPLGGDHPDPPNHDFGSRYDD